jgi:hypothetical protein
VPYNCEACGQPIFFVELDQGGRMPCDQPAVACLLAKYQRERERKRKARGKAADSPRTVRGSNQVATAPRVAEHPRPRAVRAHDEPETAAVGVLADLESRHRSGIPRPVNFFRKMCRFGVDIPSSRTYI